LANAKELPETSGKNLVPILKSGSKSFKQPVFAGRERHTHARPDNVGYPSRAIRTDQFFYFRNFKPDRWPLGDPYRLDGNNPPTAEEITEETRSTLPDEDAGPTKAWLVGVRNDPKWRSHFEWVYGKRPREELYDLKNDPHQTTNQASDPSYADIKAKLEKRLLQELSATGDPRMVNDGAFYETPPMSGPVQEEAQPNRRQKKK
jgi:hypothetical protein